MKRKLKKMKVLIVIAIICIVYLLIYKITDVVYNIPDVEYSELIDMIENEPQKITSIEVDDRTDRVAFTFLDEENKDVRKVAQFLDATSFVDFFTKQQNSNDNLKCNIEIVYHFKFWDIIDIIILITLGSLLIKLVEDYNSTDNKKIQELPIIEVTVGEMEEDFQDDVQNRFVEIEEDFQDDIQNHIVENESMRYSDIAGMRYVKESIIEVADSILNADRYIENGAKIPSGILLKGEPGTGKTILARALAGELDVPFIQYSATEMLNEFVGNSEKKVKEIFEYAKEISPCIIFFDEIDAIATSRSKNTQRYENTLLIQLLTCLDGFEPRDGVVFIAATNCPDVLDEALTRPGRFDRIINIDLPNLEEREAILKVHARNKHLSDEVDLKDIAKVTQGYSGAYLENILNEAVMFQIRNERCCIHSEDIDEAVRNVLFGNKSNFNQSDEIKHKTAVHELGHAVTSRKKIQEISIVPRGSMGGYTWFIGEELHYISASEIRDEIICYLGGRVAEEVILGDISTGSESDMKQAWKIAQDYIIEYGMSEKLGPVSFTISNETDEQSKTIIFKETNKMILEAYNEAKEIIRKNIKSIKKLSIILEEKGVISGKDFYTMLKQ